MADYTVFNKFLLSANWSLFHPLDKQRFHKALSKVINEDDFCVLHMEEYMLSFVKENKDQIRLYSIEMIINRINYLTDEATKIEAYLKRDNW